MSAVTEIRNATIDDLSALVQLSLGIQELHAAGRPDLFAAADAVVLESFFRDRLSDGSHLLLAEREGRPLGYLLAEHIQRPANPFKKASSIYYIHHIAVAIDSHSQGVGQKLMTAAKSEAIRANASAVRLDSWHFNTTAHGFFESQGFSPMNIVFEHTLLDSQ